MVSLFNTLTSHVPLKTRIVTLSHGNLKEKNGVPFQKTRASVLQKVKHGNGPASQVFIDILEDAGGFEKVKSAGEHSRNVQQIYHATIRCKIVEPLRKNKVFFALPPHCNVDWKET